MLVYLVAGEHSGDVLGGRLMAALRRLRPDLEFAGVGGARMAAEGLVSLFPMRELAVMGLLEVLPRLLSLRRRLNEVVQDVGARKPDLVVTIDSPGFCLRLLRAIAPSGVRRVQYVAPQVWAWREHRVREFPGLWDRLLCLLPFEEAFFAAHGLPARFVGHPVLESGAGDGDGARFRAAHGLSAGQRIVVLMPGSRRSEAPKLLPVYGAAMARLGDEVAAVVPTAAAVADTVARATARWARPPILVTDVADKHDAYAAAGAALTKSGTSTLELALAGAPMAVTYRVNPLTAMIARRLIRVPRVAMINLLAERDVVPELLQERCNPRDLAAAVAAMLDGEMDAQRGQFPAILETLRPPAGTPSEAAAAAVLEMLDS